MALTDPIVIVDYDPRWPRIFLLTKAQLAVRLGKAAVAIEHIGSTSVPGLAAKNIIDIDIAHEGPGITLDTINGMRAMGFDKYDEEGVPDRTFFRREPRFDGDPAVHVHVFPDGHPSLRRDLAFRDALRDDEGRAMAYELIKKNLASRYGHGTAADLEAYNAGKEAFIVAIVGARQKAARWTPPSVGGSAGGREIA